MKDIYKLYTVPLAFWRNSCTRALEDECGGVMMAERQDLFCEGVVPILVDFD